MKYFVLKILCPGVFVYLSFPVFFVVVVVVFGTQSGRRQARATPSRAATPTRRCAAS